MSDAEFTVRFRGTPPDPVSVGDELRIEGIVTVHAIEAQLVDITSLGSRIQNTVGEVSIDLYANELKVSSL